MEELLNINNLNLIKLAQENREKYINAKPFESIYFDNFFSEEFLDKVLNEFPDLSKTNAVKFDDDYQKKYGGKGENNFGPETKKLMHYLNSLPFLTFLQELTGIEEVLIGDPYFVGGGQHEIKKGGLLKIHADFNKHPNLKLDRRLNVLIYLNKNWEESYGGHFELWDEEMQGCEQKILPLFNRLAMFSTTDSSYHGHPDPLNCPDDRSRKSLALYYYTNGRPLHQINKKAEEHGTLFKTRPSEDNLLIKTTMKNVITNITPPIVLKIISRLFSKS